MSDTPKPKLPGTDVTLADGVTVVTVPPFNFRQLAEFEDRLKLLSEPRLIMDATRREGMLDLFVAAIERNHPDLTRDKLADLVTIPVAAAFVAAIAGVNQLRELQRRVEASP